MFNRKTKRLQRQMDEVLGKTARIEENNRFLHKVHEDDLGTIRSLIAERDDLMQANGEIKRDLETESRQKEELAALLSDAQKTIEDQRHTIETQQNEMHALYEKGYSTQVRFHCPNDCAKHANPGPGASVCRNCIRNPHAVDKYEVAAE